MSEVVDEAARLVRLITVMACLLGNSIAQCLASQSPQLQQDWTWTLGSQPLDDALTEFSRHTGIQIMFRPEQVVDTVISPIEGRFSGQEALDHLLHDTGLVWVAVSDRMIVVRLPLPPRDVASEAEPAAGETAVDPDGNDQAPTDMLVTTQRMPVGGARFTASALGFVQQLYDIPRSVSVINNDELDAVDVSYVDDLIRVTPGVYTLARFGVQGAIDIRNSPADVYFRGMKRVNLEGHGRSVLGVIDRINIVRGPPSPLIGMGKPGGYTDVYPRNVGSLDDAGRAPETRFVELRVGSFGKAEFNAGIGGRLPGDKLTGGYFLYGMLEDSGHYVDNVDVKNSVFQGSLELNNLFSDFRVETGFYYHRSDTSGALINRATQALVNDGVYIGGSPLVNLDLNGDGVIGFLEMHQASPVQGQLASGNQPLIQYWDWPRDSNGNALLPSQFPTVAGIPESLYQYLEQNPQQDPGGLLRAQGVGGPPPVSGWVPAGFALSPSSVSLDRFNPQRAGAYEREISADFGLFYFDLIRDVDTDYPLRNQFFVDVMDQYKLSEQPGGGKQDVMVIADRLTATLGRFTLTPDLRATLYGAANLRYTRATGYRYVGDQGNHRVDANRVDPLSDPNTRFVHSFDNDRLAEGGSPWMSRYDSRYWEAGLGMQLDAQWAEHGNLLLGWRSDLSGAVNRDAAGTLDVTQGTSSDPGRFRAEAVKVRGEDYSHSWHISYAHNLTDGIRAYITRSRSSMTLEDINNRLNNRVIENGHIGTADLREIGLRFMSARGDLYMSLSYFDQARSDRLDDGELISPSYLVPSVTQGWEFEGNWQWRHNFLVSTYLTRQATHFKPFRGANILVDARTLGFQDVFDAAGNLIYPAEAFLYGGRSFLSLPDDMTAFSMRQGYPRYQAGMLASWQPYQNWTLNLSANYFSSTFSGRLQQIKLPASAVMDLGVGHNRGPWRFRVDVNNIFDRVWLRARSRDTLGETLLTTMPGRHWRATVTYSVGR